MHSGAKLVVKTLLKAPALPGTDNNEEQQLPESFELTFLAYPIVTPHKRWLHWSSGFREKFEHTHIRKDTDSFMLRKELLNHLDLDIIGIADTHLLNTQVIEIDGYSWFGNNRSNIHIRAKKGSGGVGFLVKNDIMGQYDVVIEDDTIEGILWLKFVSNCNKAELHTCVCYLPPHESSRNIDADEFLDNLICQLHQYCKKRNVLYVWGF